MNVVYCAQFRDKSGYAVASRGYLKALDAYLQKNTDAFNLKLYSSVVEQSNRLLPEELELIMKYEFRNDRDIQKTINEDYIFIWHMPPPMISFADERFSPSPNCSPQVKRLFKNAKQNISLTVWETDTLPMEWKRDYEYYTPDMIIVPCQWNKDIINKDLPNIQCEIVPHIIEEQNLKNISMFKPIKLPFNLAEKFVVLTISQWTKRKGFDKLIQAFTAEFGNQDDALLIIKTYGGPEGDIDAISHQVKLLRNSLLVPGPVNRLPTQNNIVLIPGFIPTESILWLHQQANVFALLSRGEGFGLPIAEAIMAKKPVVVPKEGGHIDYIDPQNAFFVDGYWDTCIYAMTPYGCDGKWFESRIDSARQQLRKAYDMWSSTSNQLMYMGRQAYDYVIKKDYTPLNIGMQLFETVKALSEKDAVNIKTDSIKQKRVDLKRTLAKAETLHEKISLMKDSFKGETCYLLSCGPSLSDYDEQELREKLKDKLVLSVKQAYNKYPDITDFHFFNCCNLPNPVGDPLLEHYQYNDNEPIVVASSNYDPGQRWSPFQKTDVFFKIPIRTEIDNKFLVNTKDFEKYCLDKTIKRPCGPGIILETVLHTAVHLGVSKIIAIGYDLSKENPKKQKDHKHFYGETSKLFNRADVLPWEVKAHVNITEEMYNWLLSKDVQLELASDKSALFEGIPRITL